MKNVISFEEFYIKNKFFLYPYFLFLVLTSFILYIFSHGESLLFINSLHSEYLDIYFKFINNLGDGIFYIFIILIFLFVRLRLAIFGLASYASSGIFVQIIKHIFDTPRPKLYFGDGIILHFVQGVEIYNHNSFPSGHSASAFSLFLILSIVRKNKFESIIYFLLALSVGLARVYLCEHFFIDVLLGSFFGILFTIFLYFYLFENERILKNKIFDFSLINYYKVNIRNHLKKK